MTPLFNNKLILACNYLQTAWQGVSPSSPAARLALNPSVFYRYTLPERTALALRAIVVLIPQARPISDFVINYLIRRSLLSIRQIPTAPPRMDREYRQFADPSVVAEKLQKERQLAIAEGEHYTQPLSEFATKVQQPTRTPILNTTASPRLNSSQNPTITEAPVLSNNEPPRPIICKTDTTVVHHLGLPMTVQTSYTQGKRPTMEDEHIAQTFQINSGNTTHDVSLFGIFDGHGGAQSCAFVKNNLIHALKYYLEREPLSDVSIFNALKLTFVDLDQRFVGKSGTCASVALVLNGDLWVANTGDSRIVLDNDGRAEQLSRDAKPDRSSFYRRILHRLGQVLLKSKIPRVNGYLAVGGSIGDHCLIGTSGFGCCTPRPKLTKTPLNDIRKNSRLIIGCDGLWDVATSKEVVEAKKTAQQLMRGAYRAGSTDNISVMTIDLSSLL